METLLILIGLAVLVGIPGLLIYLVVAQIGLRRRVAALEARLDGAGASRPARASAAASEAPAAAPPAAERAAETGETSQAPGRRETTPHEAERPEPEGVDRPPPAASPAEPAPPVPPVPSAGPRGLQPSWEAHAVRWLRENWFYAVSAVSLALAGIFLVQYGIEAGLLPPPVRVLAAVVFGLLLIAAGEAIRRRYGDGEGVATAYLPSTFSGAGIVSLFAAFLSARVLYGLIGPEAAFAGLGLTAAGAILLGWFHGPLLVTVGVVGAMAAPFIVGGSSDNLTWLLGYFALPALAGLGVDAVRRWRWISVLSLGLALAAGWMTVIGDEDTAGPFILYVAGLAVAALLVPIGRLRPEHGGQPVLLALIRAKGFDEVTFATVLAFGAVLAASVSILLASVVGLLEFWIAAVTLAVMAGGLALWSARAPGIEDLALPPALALAAAAAAQAAGGEAFRAFEALLVAEDPERARAYEATWIVLLGAGISGAAYLRSMAEGRFRVLWGWAAAFYAPSLAVILEATWHPARVIGPYPWAVHAMALAAAAVVMAERFARADHADRRRVSAAALAGLAAITFAMVIVLSSAALTVALAATVVAAAALDRRFDLPGMGWFLTAATAAIGYRLSVDPGFFWAERAPMAEVVLAYGAPLLAFVAARAVLAPRKREGSDVLLESAAWSAGGLLVSVLIFRWIEAMPGASRVPSHWAMGLLASVWLGLAVVQMWRVRIGGVLAQARMALGSVFGMAGLGLLVLALFAFNPLGPLLGMGGRVLGPPVLNTLLVAYLLPGAVLIAGWPHLGPVRKPAAGLGLVLGAVWLGLAIRHFWQGPEAMEMGDGIGQGELYTYTMALLVIGAGLFVRALARGSEVLRIAGLVVIGAAVAKVFLVDISGLGGLTRVFSLLALGLSLAGLAWLNRWAKTRAAGADGGA